jgi:CheY-like chemotaxis protein
MKILIIDDSEDDILLTQMVLRKVRRTIRIETALNGEDGLALVRNGTELPALILLDLKMPRMGGLEVLHAIRADERLCRIPVIIVTHSDLESDKDASRKAGASGFLAKSVDLVRFTEDIRHVLKQFENRTGD